MKAIRFLLLAGGFCLGLTTVGAVAQDTSSVSAAFQAARQAVAPGLQAKVVSLYGMGTPLVIQKWYIIFYDPTVTSHGRAVLVENNQIVRTYAANGGAVYSEDLAFDPSRITSEGPALDAARSYASKHAIAYDSVTALLKQTSTKRPFRWRVGLIDDHIVQGYVLVNALDDTVAAYVPASSRGKTVADSADAAGESAKDFGNNVKDTFLGIGGDLQEFFTGERTVDK